MSSVQRHRSGHHQDMSATQMFQRDRATLLSHSANWLKCGLQEIGAKKNFHCSSNLHSTNHFLSKTFSLPKFSFHTITLDIFVGVVFVVFFFKEILYMQSGTLSAHKKWTQRSPPSLGRSDYYLINPFLCYTYTDCLNSTGHRIQPGVLSSLGYLSISPAGSAGH